MVNEIEDFNYEIRELKNLLDSLPSVKNIEIIETSSSTKINSRVRVNNSSSYVNKSSVY